MNVLRSFVPQSTHSAPKRSNVSFRIEITLRCLFFTARLEHAKHRSTFLRNLLVRPQSAHLLLTGITGEICNARIVRCSRRNRRNYPYWTWICCSVWTPRILVFDSTAMTALICSIVPFLQMVTMLSVVTAWAFLVFTRHIMLLLKYKGLC